MLKGIDRHLSAELVHVLMLMGHGDTLVICDVNHPAASIAAKTTHGRIVDMVGCDIPTGLAAILTLMPLDTFVDAPVARMQVVGDPGGQVPVFGLVQAVLDAAEGRAVQVEALERFAFYEAAGRAFAIVRTSDPGPYGCFILKKGVVDLPRL
ncbi:RbsD/FucU family protein [Cypionkella sinensis]|uniref:RbsD/FucU family protein n=1 Tax=Cypionkella sinensis TaxID=1756043 RepID=A0ABV7IXU5_9RHOB